MENICWIPGRREVPFLRGKRLRLPPRCGSPDPSDLKAVRQWVRGLRGYTAIDLFSGAGGLSLGLAEAGFKVLVGADADPYAVETHLANIGGLGYLGDLSDPSGLLSSLSNWGIKSVDLVAGGVPCQPFSRAGRSKIRDLVESGIRPAEDPRTSLWRPFIDVVKALQPRAVLLENVPDLAVWNDGAVILGFRESLRELGYWTHMTIINAFDYGVPQHRARLFVVGLRYGRPFNWPKPKKDRITLRDAISDLPEVAPGQREERIPYFGPQTILQQRMRARVRKPDKEWIYDHITRAVRPDDAQAFALLEQGQTYEDLPEELRRYRSDIFTDKYNRLKWDGLSRSITAHMAKDAYWYIHPEQDRTLSIREAARIQTFPDNFRFSGEPTHRYRQIGNAVPPLLAQAVGRAIRSNLQQTGRPPKRVSFRERLLDWHRDNVRSLPWREEADPWRVLMAEMSLRRTRFDQVVSVYNKLAALAATPADVNRDPDAIRQAIMSLGLRWIAENVIHLAQAIDTQYDGLVPSSLEELRSLPGVSEYVANAVINFAFGRFAVVIDSNIERFAKRIQGIEKANRWQLRSMIYDWAGPQGPDKYFNSALLDLAAVACRHVKPDCFQCPVKSLCNQVK